MGFCIGCNSRETMKEESLSECGYLPTQMKFLSEVNGLIRVPEFKTFVPTWFYCDRHTPFSAKCIWCKFKIKHLDKDHIVCPEILKHVDIRAEIPIDIPYGS